MAAVNPRLQLGDSWVVEEDSQEYDQNNDSEDQAHAVTPRRRSPRNNRSPEPDLVMPSLIVDSMHGSWAETTGRSPRNKGRRSHERQEESYQRVTHSSMNNGSPKKRERNPYRNDTVKTPMRERITESESNHLQDTFNITLDHIASMSFWLLDIVTGALKVLKKPLSYILAALILFGFFVTVRNVVTSSIYSSLSPLCRVPGASLLGLPFCPILNADSQHGPPPPVEFEELMTVQAKFEEVLEASAGGVSLPMDMKRSEASIRDLRQLVKHSHLPSKSELVHEFDGFIETARKASYDLLRFNSHVGKAVDSVIAITRWTTRVLDDIQQKEVSQGSITAFINNNLLAPFQPRKFTENLLLDRYILHTRFVGEEIHKLITEAQAVLIVLTNLEDRLDVIHDIATGDDIHTTALREEILSELWTIIGGNRVKLNKMNREIDLIKEVGIYRKIAYAHIAGTIIRLQAMGEGLEDLRERVGSPELLRDRLDIPLSVHIESIQKGVERLEESRQNSRKLEEEHIKRTLERGGLEGTLIDG